MGQSEFYAYTYVCIYIYIYIFGYSRNTIVICDIRNAVNGRRNTGVEMLVFAE